MMTCASSLLFNRRMSVKGYIEFIEINQLWSSVKGIYLSKALTCMKIFLYKQELLFVKETDTFGKIVV